MEKHWASQIVNWITPDNRRTRFATFALLALIALAVLAARQTDLWEDTEGRSFDLLSTISPAMPQEPGVTIVAIDEPSMDAVGQQWPWARSTHAKLIESLRRAGVRAIAFDVIFAEPTNPAEDQSLAGAMGPDIVLAADESLIERPYGAVLTRTEPMVELVEGGAKSGVASLEMNRDGVLRRVPVYPDGFMATLLQLSGEQAAPNAEEPRYIQYFGPPGSYPTISYYQALEPEKYLPPDYLRDQLVIVGFALQATADVGKGSTDAFETSYTMRSRLLSPGVEIQATIFDNLRTGLAVNLAPAWISAALTVICAFLTVILSQPQAPWKKAGLLVIALLALIATSWCLLRFGRIWLTTLGGGVALTLGVVTLAARDFATEQIRRKQVQNAFGQYLSPEMVKKIADDPSLLNLGGENREMTVLFSDIRGFTAISEAMKDDPQGLTRLINAILTPLSNIITNHGGTIDKYMGDCVMAFWNAPLDDPEHATHALQAAQEMLAAMGDINRQVQTMMPPGPSVPAIKMGIGINTGNCVVGNMGSDRHFDYSVLGDTVNVASRLEGQCKEYQADILIGQRTVELAPTMAFRKVSDIQVKGRTVPVAVYTLES